MQFHVAKSADAAVVSAILLAAASNLRDKGLELWSAADLSACAVAEHVNAGQYYLGFDGTEAVGVFRLQTRDPVFWPEMADGTSTYLQKLALHPSKHRQGFAHRLLRHAVDLTRARGVEFIRLDCMGGRPKLRAVYERFGFAHHSQKLLGGQVFERFELNISDFEADPAKKPMSIV